MQGKIVIMGIGNILLCDEGFGVAALEYLQRNYAWPDNVEFVDGGTRGLMLLGEIMDSSLLVVLDIVLGQGEPGSFYTLEGEELMAFAGFRHSMHQTNFADTLACCELAGSMPHTILFGFEPFEWKTLKPGISDNAKALLPAFCGKVVEKLKESGIEIHGA